MVDVVQLVRASDCGSECRGFESHHPPLQEIKRKSFKDLRFFFCTSIVTMTKILQLYIY